MHRFAHGSPIMRNVPCGNNVFMSLTWYIGSYMEFLVDQVNLSKCSLMSHQMAYGSSRRSASGDARCRLCRLIDRVMHSSIHGECCGWFNLTLHQKNTRYYTNGSTCDNKVLHGCYIGIYNSIWLWYSFKRIFLCYCHSVPHPVGLVWLVRVCTLYTEIRLLNY